MTFPVPDYILNPFFYITISFLLIEMLHEESPRIFRHFVLCTMFSPSFIDCSRRDLLVENLLLRPKYITFAFFVCRNEEIDQGTAFVGSFGRS
jgi:hypothetical protein